ncbi:MAG: DUF6285 domain-containing protein [Acidimicrobiales bacterium]
MTDQSAGVGPLPPGDPLYGSPTAPELLHAVGHFLRHQVPERLPPLEAFHARVAANVVAMVARQLEAGDAPRAEVAALFAQAGVADEDALAQAVRAGDFDDRKAQLRRVLTASVRARLAVANPAYLAANPEAAPG